MSNCRVAMEWYHATRHTRTPQYKFSARSRILISIRRALACRSIWALTDTVSMHGKKKEEPTMNFSHSISIWTPSVSIVLSVTCGHHCIAVKHIVHGVVDHQHVERWGCNHRALTHAFLRGSDVDS